MHRSSETIGAIAAALAKAQGELTNPEKSLTGAVSGSGLGGGRTFRYAPLSSGLEIVRKSLGRHEIAAVQTTAIDSEAGLVRLTTVLAHSSGEWISSEWPVCPVADTATPHRMGAALTYARRYALFTLVGIAGEDDLDAPDLGSATQGNGLVQTTPTSHGRAPAVHTTNAGNGFSHRVVNCPPAPVLNPSDSAALREQLIKALDEISSLEQLTTWARRQLPVKNKLASDDAQQLEDGFRARLSAIEKLTPSEGLGNRLDDEYSSHNAVSLIDSNFASAADVVNPKKESADRDAEGDALEFGEPRRQRDKAHLKFVASKACLICGRQPADPHHLKYAQRRALGRKVSDEFTVPLCRTHHREVHRSSEERSWWTGFGIEPLQIASALWTQTRPCPPARRRRDATQPVSKTQKISASGQLFSTRTCNQNFKTKPNGKGRHS